MRLVLPPAVTAVLALLVLAALGLAARPRVDLDLDPVPSGPGDVAALVVASAAWVLATAVVLARTAADGDVRRALRLAVILDVVLLGLAWAVLSERGLAAFARELPRAGAAPIVPDSWDLWVELGWTRWLLAGGLVAVVLAGAVGVLVATGRWLRRRRSDRTVQERRFGRGRSTSGEVTDLRDALASARRALRGGATTDEESRRAVIAAYAAFERVVVGSGADRRPSQTPEEFLTRVAAQGLVTRVDVARRLIGLFELARFSAAPLPPDAASAADDHLAVLERDLDLRPASTPAAGRGGAS